MNSSRQSSLPSHFINAMRTLFNIIDKDSTGYISLQELVHRWSQSPPDSATGIPPGFIDCLKRVTPPNGLLTFERFCAGLRLALAEQRLDSQRLNYPHKRNSSSKLHKKSGGSGGSSAVSATNINNNNINKNSLIDTNRRLSATLQQSSDPRHPTPEVVHQLTFENEKKTQRQFLNQQQIVYSAPDIRHRKPSIVLPTTAAASAAVVKQLGMKEQTQSSRSSRLSSMMNNNSATQQNYKASNQIKEQKFEEQAQKRSINNGNCSSMRANDFGGSQPAIFNINQRQKEPIYHNGQMMNQNKDNKGRSNHGRILNGALSTSSIVVQRQPHQQLAETNNSMNRNYSKPPAYGQQQKQAKLRQAVPPPPAPGQYHPSLPEGLQGPKIHLLASAAVNNGNPHPRQQLAGSSSSSTSSSTTSRNSSSSATGTTWNEGTIRRGPGHPQNQHRPPPGYGNGQDSLSHLENEGDRIQWRQQDLSIVTNQNGHNHHNNHQQGLEGTNRRHTTDLGQMNNNRNGFVDRNGLNNERQSRHQQTMVEEQELLERGLNSAAKLANFYHSRMNKLQTRNKLAGKSMVPLDYAVHEEKVNYLRAHVTELNRRIGDVVESSDRGFPAHPTSTKTLGTISQAEEEQLLWLKRQNEMLTQEVSDKAERIHQLEVMADQQEQHRSHGGSRSRTDSRQQTGFGQGLHRPKAAYSLSSNTTTPSSASPPLTASTPSPPSHSDGSSTSNKSSGRNGQHLRSQNRQDSGMIEGNQGLATLLKATVGQTQHRFHQLNHVKSASDPIENLYKDYQATLI